MNNTIAEKYIVFIGDLIRNIQAFFVVKRMENAKGFALTLIKIGK